MSIHIYPSQKQIKGNFNGGEIMENKPIQMSHDHTKLQPYSNIFYWAHAWAEVTSTIGLHPHQAFEIVSFVLTGTVEHYDTKNKTWLPLQAGDVQIIRAGNGISHAEKMLEGTHMFQIWFDPNINISLLQPATYNDYKSSEFAVIEEPGKTIKVLKGEGAPLEMMTPGLSIQQLTLAPQLHTLELNNTHSHAFYVISGQVTTEKGLIDKDDFFIVDEGGAFTFTTEVETQLFLISALKTLDYTTYAAGNN